MADSLNLFERLQLLDTKTIDTVHGFVRRAQLLLPNDRAYYNIPPLINKIILLYFGELKEKFAIYGDKMKCSPDGDKVTMTTGSVWNTAFGQIEIDAKSNPNVIYEWVLGIHSDTVCVGIVSSKQKESISSTLFWNKKIDPQHWDASMQHFFYYYHGMGMKRSHETSGDSERGYATYSYNVNVKIQCDLKQKKLRFYKGDQVTVVFDTFDTSHVYNIAVAISGDGDHVTIESFKYFQ